MPEGDTVWRAAQRLNRLFANAPLITCDLRWPDLATLDYTGSTTVEVVSRGKHLLHRLDNGVTIHSHFRMEGSWRVQPTGETVRPSSQVRAILATADWTALGVRLGMLDVVRTGDEHTLVGHLGPDLLGSDWDATEALTRLRSSAGTIGAALLDQSNLAGIGTLWAAESLFLQRLNPWTPVANLDPESIAAVIARAHRLLLANRDHPVQSSTGSRQRGENTYVHARSGRPCRRCGQGVRVALIGPDTRQRTMFYCPGCQGGLGPTDDGKPQRPLGAEGSRRTRGTKRPGRG